MILDKLLLSHNIDSDWKFISWMLTWVLLSFFFFFLNLKLIKIYLRLYGFCCFMIVVSWGSWFNYVLSQLWLIYMLAIGYFYVRPLLISNFFPWCIYACFMLWLLFTRIFFNGLLLGSLFPFFPLLCYDTNYSLG